MSDVDQAAIDRLKRWRDVGDGPVTYTAGSKQFADDVIVLIAEIERMRTALVKLSNEVLGSLPMIETIARQEMGNTNYAILIQRAEEAREALLPTGRKTG